MKQDSRIVALMEKKKEANVQVQSQRELDLDFINNLHHILHLFFKK